MTKTLEQILQQEPVFLADWKGWTQEEIFGDFAGNCYFTDRVGEERQFEGYNILFATYSYENYYGDAFVLCEKDGKLYEVHGSHCSCYGLEGQWEPEETTLEALKRQLVHGAICSPECDRALWEFIGCSK